MAHEQQLQIRTELKHQLKRENTKKKRHGEVHCTCYNFRCVCVCVCVCMCVSFVRANYFFFGGRDFVRLYFCVLYTVSSKTFSISLLEETLFISQLSSPVTFFSMLGL